MEIFLLGSADAISDEKHPNTHLLVKSGAQTILIDCPDNPIPRMQKAGIAYQDLTDIIITHFHPDHAGGIATLFMDLWLLGRKHTIHLYGLDYTIDRIAGMMGLYNWNAWPNFYPVEMHRIPSEEGIEVLATGDLKVISSPVCHLIPNIGLRFEAADNKKSAAYSSDTAFCQEVVTLAQDVDLLFHESSGPYPGHSSAIQAAEVAHKACAHKLCLVHYPSSSLNSKKLLGQARQVFRGEVIIGKAGMKFSL